MAVTIMGGLTVATLLTLIFLPALYVAAFRIGPDDAPDRRPRRKHRGPPESRCHIAMLTSWNE